MQVEGRLFYLRLTYDYLGKPIIMRLLQRIYLQQFSPATFPSSGYVSKPTSHGNCLLWSQVTIENSFTFILSSTSASNNLNYKMMLNSFHTANGQVGDVKLRWPPEWWLQIKIGWHSKFKQSSLLKTTTNSIRPTINIFALSRPWWVLCVFMLLVCCPSNSSGGRQESLLSAAELMDRKIIIS